MRPYSNCVHLLFAACFLVLLPPALAQVQLPGGQQQPIAANQNNFPGGNQGNVMGVGQGFGNALGSGLSGGAQQADFDSLIDLIQTTVAYDTWSENGTGEGEISPFAINGVYADAAGVLRFEKESGATAKLQLKPRPESSAEVADARAKSPLRYVSLPRLEQEIVRLQREHQPLPEEMFTLAGLRRVDYVLVNPETHDVILAGPAGDWLVESPGIVVSKATGAAVLRLDDLLTLLRREEHKAFGCSIVPRQEALAQTQEYLASTGREPIEPSRRKQWLTGLRDSLGTQDVEFFGLTANSHVAQVLLLADYHMKLIGMGLADGVEGVESYLATVRLLPDGSAPPMNVLRWWFAMQPCEVTANAENTVFQLSGDVVQVLSENEMLAARGQRVHTNQSEELNTRFARSFTEHFAELAQKYPLYGELESIFRLELVRGVIESQKLYDRADWHPTALVDSATLPLPGYRVPQEVETVVNHRMLGRRTIVAGISGGVWLDAKQSLRMSAAIDAGEAPVAVDSAERPLQRWWWD